MNQAIFVTARTNSSRLPKKAMQKIYEEVSLLEHVLLRAKLAKNADTVVLCTTNKKEDLELVSIAEACNVEVFCGEVNDKLMRWKNAAEKFEIDLFVTHDGDDPFCDPELSDLAFTQLRQESLDFIYSDQIIPGIFTFAIRSSALNKVCEIKDSNETEMMWTYFRDTGLFKIAELRGFPDEFIQGEVRLTVDYPEDLILVRKIFEQIPMKESIKVQSVLKLLTDNIYLREINWFRNEEFLANQKNRTNLKLKA